MEGEAEGGACGGGSVNADVGDEGGDGDDGRDGVDAIGSKPR